MWRAADGGGAKMLYMDRGDGEDGLWVLVTCFRVLGVELSRPSSYDCKGFEPTRESALSISQVGTGISLRSQTPPFSLNEPSVMSRTNMRVEVAGRSRRSIPCLIDDGVLVEFAA